MILKKGYTVSSKVGFLSGISPCFKVSRPPADHFFYQLVTNKRRKIGILALRPQCSNPVSRLKIGYAIRHILFLCLRRSCENPLGKETPQVFLSMAFERSEKDIVRHPVERRSCENPPLKEARKTLFDTPDVRNYMYTVSGFLCKKNTHSTEVKQVFIVNPIGFVDSIRCVCSRTRIR